MSREWPFPRYEFVDLKRGRVLQIRSSPRGVTINPKKRFLGLPEIVHTDSVIVLCQFTSRAHVIEWTGAEQENHLAWI